MTEPGRATDRKMLTGQGEDAACWSFPLRDGRARMGGRPPVLVCLHGFLGSSQDWADPAENIAPGNWIAVDLPGHGDADPAAYRTPPGDSAVERLADQLACAIADELDPPVRLLGYSMGGRIALTLASRHRHLVQALIIESASPGIESAEERARRRASDATLAARLVADGLESFLDRWYRAELFGALRNHGGFASLRESRLAGNAEWLAWALETYGQGIMLPMWHALEGLAIPTLIVTGSDDHRYRAIGSRMAGLMPSARHSVVHGAAHTVHFEKPDDFATQVRSFCDHISHERGENS